MSSIALFQSIFTKEKEIREKLEMASGYKVVQDDDIIAETSRLYNISKEKVSRALYTPTSVFNKFTHEREYITACLKLVLAKQVQSSNVLFSGFIVHLIPNNISQVLKAGIFDEKIHRIQRAIAEGLTENKATKLIKKNDRKATDWTDFLLAKAASDPALYDIVIPLGASSAEAATQLIMENYQKPALLETPESRQSVEDMEIGARVELALMAKGYTNEVRVQNSHATLCVNKSVLNFSRLSNTLTQIAGAVDGVQGVEVITGQNYHMSVYRDQEFILPPKVLLVDDEQEFVQTLSERLNTRDYGSYPVFDGEQALDLLSNETPDVMVLDLKMPGINGVEVLQKTKEAKPEIEIIILTGHGTEDDKRQCLDLGAYAYLQKPADITILTETIDKAYREVAAKKLASA